MPGDNDVTYEWDAGKNARCLAERGFDFVFAIKVFVADERVEWEDRRQVGLAPLKETLP